jgi:hypothetical protein
MLHRNQFLSGLGAVVALAMTACSGSVARPVDGTARPLVCAGGSVRSSAEAAVYAACDTVQGDLRITGRDVELEAFAGLRHVTGRLEISGNAVIDDLSGLERLTQVGELLIRDNPELETLRGLEGLVRANRVVIERTGLYQTVGISALGQVGDLVVRDNARLHSLQGFRSLSHARSVEIVHNPRLCARGMLPALVKVERQLTVKANRGLSKPDLRDLFGRVESAPEVPSREASL